MRVITFHRQYLKKQRHSPWHTSSSDLQNIFWNLDHKHSYNSRICTQPQHNGLARNSRSLPKVFLILEKFSPSKITFFGPHHFSANVSDFCVCPRKHCWWTPYWLSYWAQCDSSVWFFFWQLSIPLAQQLFFKKSESVVFNTYFFARLMQTTFQN